MTSNDNDNTAMSLQEYAKSIYKLSEMVNSADDEAFYAIEEMGEVMSAMSDLRRARTTKQDLSKEICQAIIQLEKYAYRQGILDEVWNQYTGELYQLREKIKKAMGETLYDTAK